MKRLSGGWGISPQIADIVRMRSVLPAHRNQVGGRKGSVVGEADVVVFGPGMLK